MLPPPDVAALAGLLVATVGPGPWQLDLVAASSNFVYRAEGGAVVVAVRTPRVPPARPSAFWRQLWEVFGLGFPATPAQARAVREHVGLVGGLAAPTLLAHGVVAGRPVLVDSWLEGDAWAPDELPAGAAANRDLGSFLARVHGARFDGFGVLGERRRGGAEYRDAAVAAAVRTLDECWAPADRRRLREVLRAPPAPGAGDGFALVMPDLSANQFLFSGPGGGLAGVVDLDAYVVGPIELELTMAEWCVTDPAAFREGYEVVRRLPAIGPFRAFHRATMLVNEPAVAADVERLLEDRIHFD